MEEFTKEVKIGVREGGPPEEESACTATEAADAGNRTHRWRVTGARLDT